MFKTPDQFKPETTKSAEQRILDLEARIAELESDRKIALQKIAEQIASHKTKSKKERAAESEPKVLEFPPAVRVRSLEFVKDNKKFHFEAKGFGGELKEISQTEVLTDVRQGIFYDLNHEVVSVEHNKKYNHFREKYILAYYDWLISQQQKQLLIIKRLEIDNIGSQDTFLAKAYEAHLEAGHEKKAGFVFEQIITGVLQKIAIDLGEKWGLQFEDADVIDDVELKALAIIKIKQKNRGVGVDKEENETVTGIQFTLRKSGDPDFERKKEQVAKAKARHGGTKRRIDDLVLIEVSVGNKEIMGFLHEWELHNRPAGGPEKFISINLLVDEFLKKIFMETDLDLTKNIEFRQDLWKYFEQNGYRKV